MSVVTTLAGRPISDPGVRRIQFSLVGYAIASFAIFLAWVGAAGVETSPLNFYSGPTRRRWSCCSWLSPYSSPVQP